jgi:hypothetical protein
LIHGRYQAKRFVREVRSKDDLEFKIVQIQQLNDVADSLLENLTVVLDHKTVSPGLLHLLQEELKPQGDAPAKTDLYFELVDKANNYNVGMYSRRQKVRVTNELIEFLRGQEGVDCKINGHYVEEETTPKKEGDEEEEVVLEEEMVD